jgi:serine kinase of HPr protein (carbohydrate metabolism regulator)
MAAEAASIHASAVLVGAHAVLIRGPSGAGKSRLAWELIQAAGSNLVAFARLIADDRAHLEPHGGQLLVRPAPALAGLIEIHGVGIRRLEYEAVAVVGLVADLAAPDASRLPPQAAREVLIEGVRLPRLAVAPGMPVLPGVLALLTSADARR